MLMGGRRLGTGGLGPEGMRHCPSCDEAVAPHAVACRHCGVTLSAGSAADELAAPPASGEPGTPQRRDRHQAASLHSAGAPDTQQPDTEQPDTQQPDTRHRKASRREPTHGAGPAEEPAWNVPHEPRADTATPEAQWSESDFERISQTAGLPREDPRTRQPRPRRTGFRPWRRQSAGAAPARRRVGRDRRVAWVAGAVALAVVGATAGWLVGRWDEASWLGRQYQLAADLMRSVRPLPEMLPGSARQAGAAAAAPAAAEAVPPAEPSRATMPAPGAAAPAVLDPRPVAALPAGGDRIAARTGPETSLVPIRPTTAPAPLAEPRAPAPALTTDPWSVRDVQRELARLGYYQGGVDGEVGPMTRNAVRAFQQDAGLPATGRIEPAVLTALANRVPATATPAAGRRSGSQ